jgi:galactokinase
MSDAKYEGSLRDGDSLAVYLRGCGFAEGPAETKADMLARCAEGLDEISGDAGGQPRAYWVPGRIEVLGKHTDYAGGSSLVVAAERGFCLTATGSGDDEVVVFDVVRGETITFPITPDLVVSAGQWSNYPMTVARRLARNFPGRWRGVRIAMASDLPPAAGMSSSSALMIAVFYALADVNDIWNHPCFPELLSDPLQLAGYLATIENGQSYGELVGDRGVGTFGGSEDHTAILCARPGTIRQFAYCPVRFQRDLPVPDGHVLAVAASGVVAEKTGEACEKYNRASQRAAVLAELWRCQTGRSDSQLASALQSVPAAEHRLKELLEHTEHAEFDRGELLARLEHFIEENRRVIPAAGDALERGDLVEFGRVVDRSQRAAERLLGNQVRETCYLAAAARQLGAVAASAFGAGFGGSVWALVQADRADALLATWREGYLARFPKHADRCEFFTTAAGPAAIVIV